MKTIAIPAFLFLLVLLACRKETFITSRDANLSITADTLHYDTVFTSVGSITQSFKIINDNNRKLRLSSVKLMGGNASAFSMNVDGAVTDNATNIEIDANDSLYVFVQVNVDPASNNLPFIIRDSIQISYNGNEKFVQLEAWGQNAHFMREKIVGPNETWSNDLPYLIQGFLYVEPGSTLTIQKGCRIYVHADAPIIVDGTLNVNGEKDTADRVVFKGDRLDVPYKDFPAGWPGIYFRAGSRNNVFTYAEVRNAYQAIAVEDPAPNANPKLTLNQCVIDNGYDAGIIAINSSITANNCLISNCGKNIALGKGGNYQFRHCTVASVSNPYVQHKEPVLTLSDANGTSTNTLTAAFTNCIFWGENELIENEVVAEKNSSASSILFKGVLWRMKTISALLTVITPPAPANNQDPQFDSINVSKNYYDFRIRRRNSPAVDAGDDNTLPLDLDGLPRPAGLKPDLGCFEKQ